ncbi:App1 family protein [Corynebacterium epidermidicanis]|uniref:Phosphatidate phosphatase APP1 catalytic domain-containing protein n=1 Tax=Corynebacterium epidermidicanis TaxID=1050174 RepID=A0A0G3GL87_9CORY|nr:phosphatase domain-containing protein [Corynebacterium epidermidicanis]AKK02001.1 hypothetical protein CEPID_00535 [Corynebacterium epidermidicanis]
MALADIARKAEHLINRVGTERKRKAGWKPQATGYFGFGDTSKVRVLGRVLMEPDHAPQNEAQRGFRQFFTTQVGHEPVVVRAGDREVETRTNDNGYLDILIRDHHLTPGWHEVHIDVPAGRPATAEVLILEPGTEVGLVSDIDDTVMVTMLPRAMIAAYNSWFLHTDARKPVPGMADFYQSLRQTYGAELPVFYLSTGAWNTFPALVNFMQRFGFPKGPMLLTDWGPTPTGLFRNGQSHKMVQLRNLIIDFPDIKWILVGDDGQHDPLTYGNISSEHPSRVLGVAIRELTPGEHVLAHGTAAPIEPARRSGVADVPWITGADGFELQRALKDAPFPDPN